MEKAVYSLPAVPVPADHRYGDVLLHDSTPISEVIGPKLAPFWPKSRYQYTDLVTPVTPFTHSPVPSRSVHFP